MKNYKVFHRTWWKLNPEWPDGREPCIGRSYHISWASTEEEARSICKEWNKTHLPGHLADQAEYTKV
jgi:hypothetical protein